MEKLVYSSDLKSDASQHPGSTPGTRTKLINKDMQVKIFINEKLYKTVTVPGETYEPGTFWAQIFADKEAGLLNSFDVSETMSVRYEAIQ